MQVREKYEIRRKNSLDTAKPKASEVTIKKRPEKTSKVTAESNKSAAESSGKNKEKGNQNTEKQGQPTSSTNTAVSTPDKTISNTVHSENQHTDPATKVVTNKTDLNIPRR